MILDKILAIFLIMGVGFAARKAKAIDGEFVRALSAFMINLALPFALLGSFDRSIPRSTLPELGVMLLWSAGAHAFAIGLASLLYRKFPDNQRKVLTFTTVFTAFIHLGVVIGLLPNTGLTLPFVSYGRSNLVLTLAMTGILVNIGSERERVYGVSATDPLVAPVS